MLSSLLVNAFNNTGINPDITPRDARITQNFDPSSKSFVIDDSVTSGTVVRTDPAAGQQVEGDATVTLYIAQASIDTTVELVSVEGLQVEEARARLTRLLPEALGLTAFF